MTWSQVDIVVMSHKRNRTDRKLFYDDQLNKEGITAPRIYCTEHDNGINCPVAVLVLS